MTTITYKTEKLQWKQFPWYAQIAIVISLIEAIFFAIGVILGFTEGMMMF